MRHEFSDVDLRFKDAVRARCRFLNPGESLDPEGHLSDLGIDSMAAVDLLIDLEDRFNIVFPDELLTPEVFESVGSLWNALSKVLAEEGVSQPG